MTPDEINESREAFEVRKELSPQEWYHQRVDDEEYGAIFYELHGPKSSFIVFNGPNAKADCMTCLAALNTTKRSEE